MDKQYKDLMEKQTIGEEANAAFYEKLNKTEKQRKPLGWKVAIIAACLAIMIPATVFAVETIIRVPKVKLGQLSWTDSPNGYSVRFDNMESFPAEAFPEEVRALQTHKHLACDTWETAEAAVGVDLLNNSFLEEVPKMTMYFDDLGRVHSKVLYSQYEGQLILVSI